MKLYARPTSTSMNPSAPEGAEYFDHGQTIYILNVGTAAAPKLRAWTTFGSLNIDVNARHEVISDQTGRSLAGWRGAEIVGTRCADGEIFGDVPNRKLPHWVAK